MWNNKGSTTPTVIFIAVIVILLALPIVNFNSNANTAVKGNISRMQKYYSIKAELTRVASILKTNPDYFMTNRPGSLGAFSHEIMSADKTETTGTVYDSVADSYTTETLSETYTYTMKINIETFIITVLHTHYELNTAVDVVEVSLKNANTSTELVNPLGY